MKTKKLLLIKPYLGGLSGVKPTNLVPQSLFNLGSITLDLCDNWDVKICYRKNDKIKYNNDFDLVGITINTSEAIVGYEIADKFRSIGVPVILGGIHATYCTEEAKEHADCIVTGEAEEIFPQIIKDFENNKLKKAYNAGIISDLSKIPIPTPKIIKEWRGVRPYVIQTTRGCPINCDFCTVTKFNGPKIRLRPIPDVVESIKRFIKYGKRMLGKYYFFFVDDNIFIDKKYARELFEAIKPFDIRWICQTSIYIARDKELLRLAHSAGCRVATVGFESIYQSSLKQVNKKYNAEEYEQLIKNFHEAGISIYASLIFGFDDEPKSTAKDTVKFLIDNKVEMAQFSIMTPFPGTRIREQMLEDNLIKHNNWTYYSMTKAVFRSKNWTEKDLLFVHRKAFFSFYTYKSIFIRMKEMFKNMEFIFSLSITVVNLLFRKHVKMRCKEYGVLEDIKKDIKKHGLL